MTVSHNQHVYNPSGTVVAGTPKVVYIPSFAGKLGIQVKPGGGGTMGVEYTLSSVADILANSAVWTAWTPGTVGAATQAWTDQPMIAMRITATTANGAYSLVL